MKYFLTAQVEATNLKGIVVALDGGIAASIEAGELGRQAEAPDKSGRYSFKLETMPTLPFGDVYNEKVINNLKTKITELEKENESFKNELSLANIKVDEIKEVNTQLKEQVSEPESYKRLRAY